MWLPGKYCWISQAYVVLEGGFLDSRIHGVRNCGLDLCPADHLVVLVVRSNHARSLISKLDDDSVDPFAKAGELAEEG